MYLKSILVVARNIFRFFPAKQLENLIGLVSMNLETFLNKFQGIAQKLSRLLSECNLTSIEEGFN